MTVHQSKAGTEARNRGVRGTKIVNDTKYVSAAKRQIQQRREPEEPGDHQRYTITGASASRSRYLLLTGKPKVDARRRCGQYHEWQITDMHLNHGAGQRDTQRSHPVIPFGNTPHCQQKGKIHEKRHVRVPDSYKLVRPNAMNE